MKRLQKKLLFYVTFSLICGFMILIYVFDPRISGTEDLSVQKTDMASQAEDTIKTLMLADQKSHSMRPEWSCNCNLSTAGAPGTLDFETPASCGPQRTYFDEMVKKFKAVDPNQYFTQNRPKELLDKAEVPKSCVLFAMRNFERASERGPSSAFAQCESMSQLPKAGLYKPCVDEGYVDLVYNSFVDVASCMGLPQKMMTAKLMQESGFHINAFSRLRKINDQTTLGGDAGITQLTSSAIQDAALTLDHHMDAIRKATDNACKRVSGLLSGMPTAASLSSDINQRCQVIATPPNPLFNLILYAIVYKNNKASVDTNWDAAHDDIDNLMNQAKISDYDKSKIKEMLIVLSYNAGPKRAVKFLKEWLQYRIQSSTDPSLSAAHAAAIAKNDFDFGAASNSKLLAMTQDQIEALKQEQLSIAGNPAKAKRLKELQSLGLFQMNFPTYLRIYRQVGDRAYLSNVKDSAKALDRALGQGTCTEIPFLAL